MASLIAIAATSMTSCSSDDDNNDNGGNDKTEYVWSTDGGLKACDHLLFSEMDNSENASGKQIGNGDAEFVFTGKQTLKKGTYLLKGWVYIANGAELTIEPGTIIKGDKQTKASLIVERGGKLIAQGSATAPIVFTSEESAGNRESGDWGGIIICGKARNNQTEMQIEGGPRTKHGGNDDADNSGVLSYVRIEFAGYPFQTDQEINGLTLGSVGSATKIDHVQVSYSNDDSFEWFGGTVNCRYLVAFHGWDDDFDTDNGSALGKFQSAMQILRSSRLNVINSVAAGWPIGLIIDGEKGDTPAQAKAGTIRFHNNVFAGMDIIGSDANKVYEDVLYDAVNKTVIDANKKSYSNSFFYLETLKDKSYSESSSLSLIDACGVGSPFMPSAASPLLTLASFDGEASWFDKVAYVGAFSATDNRLNGWTSFDPQNEKY